MSKYDNKLSYSSGAVSIRNQFLDVDFVVYVEGDDDIPFWDGLFGDKISTEKFKIEQVNGKENLRKYIDGIINETMFNVVVACDSDYTKYTGELWVNNPRIIVTYGHSIENTMFCPNSIAVYLRTMSRTTKNYFSEVESWFQEFCDSAKLLLPYDIENGINKNVKTACYCSGYHRFKNELIPVNIDNDKIKQFIESIKDKFENSNISNIFTKIKEDERELRCILQGHFLKDAVQEFIRSKLKQDIGKCPSISKESLYESFAKCKSNTCKSTCADILFVNTQIDDFLLTLKQAS